MKLGRATGYALHALAYLARQKTKDLVSTKAIAAATGIPDVFLLKALKPLVTHRMLNSITGPRGGYQLAKRATSITVLEVIEAAEGRFVTGAAVQIGGKRSTVDRTLDRLIQEATRKVRQVFGSMTVAKLGSGGTRTVKKTTRKRGKK